MPDDDKPASRYLTMQAVADELSTTMAQVYALVRRKDLRAFKLGGRGQWRIARTDLEQFIEHAYTETSTWIDTHPFAGDEHPATDD